MTCVYNISVYGIYVVEEEGGRRRRRRRWSNNYSKRGTPYVYLYSFIATFSVKLYVFETSM